MGLAAIPDLLVMADHFVDNEAKEFFGKIGIELGIAGELAKPVDLSFLARRVGWGQRRLCLMFTHSLGNFEAFGEHEHQRRVDIVDTVAVAFEDIVVTHRPPSAASRRFRQGQMRLLHLPCRKCLGRAGMK